MAQIIGKNLPAIQKTWVGSLGWEIPWRRAWQPIPVFLPVESPWTEEPGGLQSMGSQRVWYDWVTKHSTVSSVQHSQLPKDESRYGLWGDTAQYLQWMRSNLHQNLAVDQWDVSASSCWYPFHLHTFPRQAESLPEPHSYILTLVFIKMLLINFCCSCVSFCSPATWTSGTYTYILSLSPQSIESPVFHSRFSLVP